MKTQLIIILKNLKLLTKKLKTPRLVCKVCLGGDKHDGCRTRRDSKALWKAKGGL